MISPSAMPLSSNSRFASQYLTEGQDYTRAELRQAVGTSDSTLDSIVFRPSGYNSVWLFITQAPVVGHSNTYDNDTFVWSGQLSRHNDQLIITHESRGLELLVFFRESATQYTGAAFRYLGRYEYQNHSETQPTVFTLARSGSAPSVAAIQATQDKQTPFNPATIRDGREWVLATIVRRRGQAAFRNSLLEAYASTCPVTGCKVEALLEAAHIIPYLGLTTNHVQNGMPLRADIHTLFDLQLLAVDPDTLTVLVAPSLQNSEYEVLAGRSISLPKEAEHHPSVEALRAHRIRCPF